jgi:hypothetical protein
MSDEDDEPIELIPVELIPKLLEAEQRWKTIDRPLELLVSVDSHGYPIDPFIQTGKLSSCDFIREVIGNPYSPSVAKDEWLTSSVITLVNLIREQSNLSLFPILADALEDAGCEEELLLQHLRQSDTPHSVHCWALALFTRKLPTIKWETDKRSSDDLPSGFYKSPQTAAGEQYQIWMSLRLDKVLDRGNHRKVFSVQLRRGGEPTIVGNTSLGVFATVEEAKTAAENHRELVARLRRMC